MIRIMKALRKISYALMAAGILLFVAGFLFRIQHWPQLLNGSVSGLMVTATGSLFFIISLIKRQEKN
jgi:ABC-type transport system involved in cytochrome c biogenesis permease subunit